MAEQHHLSEPGGFSAALPAPHAGDYAGRVLGLVAAAADWDRRAFWRAGAGEEHAAGCRGWEAGGSFFDALEAALGGQPPAGRAPSSSTGGAPPRARGADGGER